MTILAKTLLALAIASSTLAVPSRMIVIDVPQSQPPLVVKKASSIPAVLIEIGRCESGNEQFDENGEVLRGTINNFDVGKYQINELYHGAKAAELGYDLYTEEGNTSYALWLYRHEGAKPWFWSRACWEVKGR